MTRKQARKPVTRPMARVSPHRQLIPMRRLDMSAIDKAKNAVQDVAGKAKEALGDATGDESVKNEGKRDQAGADLKDAGEKVKDAFKH